MPKIFQFDLGPVQSFVAQARRTRDFWAGSFILSWLSKVAIDQVKELDGEIIFPLIDDAEPESLQGCVPNPLQGCVPNRLKAKVPDSFDGQQVKEAVLNAWRELAEKIWQGDLRHLANSPTQDIWERQVNHFWDIHWVLSEDGAHDLLSRRKNWRSQWLPEEPGHKCMMMDGWQELSGELGSNMAKLDQFWGKLREAKDPKDWFSLEIDLRKGERLCAMAFIKRRFVHYFKQVKKGKKLPRAVPSVAFMAAAPWIAKAIDEAEIKDFESFAKAAEELELARRKAEAEKLELADSSSGPMPAEPRDRQASSRLPAPSNAYTEKAHVIDQAFPIDIRCVVNAAKEKAGFKRLWAGLDGQLYFPTALQNSRLYPQNAAKVVLSALKKLCKDKEPPSPFYAILLMDGDRLGQQMADPDKQQPIAKALKDFTDGVPERVCENNGFLVYAGGDDVLALFPLEDAFPAAAALQAFYKECFNKHQQHSTLSGAIEYAHIHTPLTRVLQDAHYLLDEVAKKATGRDAIALRVWKPSGLAATWSMPWSKALDKPTLQALAKDFAQQHAPDTTSAETAQELDFSNKFFFRAKQVIERFPDMCEEDLQQVLEAEYLHSFDGKRDVPKTFHELLKQLKCWRNEEGQPRCQPGLNAEGVLLLRFFASKGLERAL